MITFPFSKNGNGHKETAPAGPIIQLRAVKKSYKTAVGDYPALKGLDLNFRAGEFVSIIGKSGSGKTTLLNMITGIDRPTDGEVWVNGTALHKMSEGQMARWRGSNMGIVFQFFQLLPTLSVMENILLAMDFAGKIPAAKRKERALYLLDLVGLADHAYKLPTALSGGQQQRVAIARALANDPPVVIADEPTGNLDSKTAEAVFGLFHKLAEQGKTIIIVTHDSSLAKRTHRTALIADGEIANEYVAQALPALSGTQLMRVSREARSVVYEPGAMILQQGGSGDEFYVVAKGTVEVILQREGTSDVVVATLDAGQYFGEMQLLNEHKRCASVRASEHAPVEVLALRHDMLRELMDESEAIRESILTLANNRQQQNRVVLGD